MNRSPAPIVRFLLLLLGVPAVSLVAQPVSGTTAPTADASVRDTAGNTPLHLAALRRDADAVDALLSRGADAAAVNDAGATALHYGVSNERIVTALLAHGAPADAVSKLGVTPLLGAVSLENAYPILQRLIAAGANVNHTGTSPASPPVPFGVLATAVRRGDARLVLLLIDHGAEVNPKNGPLPIAITAMIGDLEMTKLLLAHGANPNHRAGATAMPLTASASNRHAEVVQLLLEHGADPNERGVDRRRTSSMVFSGYNDTGDPTIARLLVERGVDVNSTDDHGDTALSYALKRGSDTPLVAYLREAGGKAPATPERGKVLPARPIPPDAALRTAMVRESAQRAIDLLQPSSKTFLTNPLVRTQRQCTSCHQEALPAVGYELALERGLRVDLNEVGRTMQAIRTELRRFEEGARQMILPGNNFKVGGGYRFDALHALRYERDSMTDSLAQYLLDQQERDGSWRAYVSRGPIEDSLPITSTAWSIRAVQLYSPPGQERLLEHALGRARAWLKNQPAKQSNEQVFQLLGLAWANASVAEMRPFAERLIAAQQPDGGWKQLSTLPSDAWATGSSLVALHKAGIATSHAAYRRGVDFLLRTQFDDGSWWVRSRSWPTQPHFDGKFPHGKDQWISAAGTAWATIALLETIDPTVPATQLPNAQQLIAAFLKSPAGKESALAAAAPNPSAAPAASIDFVRDIQPLFERSCVGCHSGARPKGGLDLTKREGLLKGGQGGGPAIIPGYADDSPLVHQVSDKIEDLEMPPLARREKYPALSPKEIARVRAWIDAGAPWKDARAAN